MPSEGRMKTLVLASGSRYRRELLERLGLPFQIRVSGIDETPEPAEHPGMLAARLARAKAMSLTESASIVIGSDQVASVDGELLGKPGTHAAALAQLEQCQGRHVVFHTAVAVYDVDAQHLQEHVDLTRVEFATHTREALASDLEREPALDCAGGFKVEGLGIALFEAVESRDPTALIGLPLIWLTAALRARGLDPLRPAD
jgi:septum formation protein